MTSRNLKQNKERCFMKQRRNKRLCALVLALAVMLTLAPAAQAAGKFTDVPADAWYAKDVAYAVEKGLVNGTTATTYSPNDNLTYGSAVKLAACIYRRTAFGDTDFPAGTPWYQPYVEFADDYAIISGLDCYDWNATAKRADFLAIFAIALSNTPSALLPGYKTLEPINTVDDGAIPDVPMTHPHAEAIYKLYRAGILQGSDAAHSCRPESSIMRSEVAAILTRMMDPAQRLTFSMTAEGMTISQQPADASAAIGEKGVLTVAVSGGKGPYTYKWFSSSDNGEHWAAIVNSSWFSGVSTASLSIKVDESTVSHCYRCEITDAAGHKAVSASAGLKATNGLTITQQPAASVKASLGEKLQLTVAVSSGSSKPTFRWLRSKDGGKSWEPIQNSQQYSGADTDTLTIQADETTTSYNYCCDISAAGWTVTSRISQCAFDNSLCIIEQPKNVAAAENSWAAFTVKAGGGKAPYTYRWEQDSVSEDFDALPLNNPEYVKGADTASLSVRATLQSWDYSFRYRCRITDANGATVYSEPVCMTSALRILRQPQNVETAEGQTRTFSVAVANGVGKVTYTWYYAVSESDGWSKIDSAGADGMFENWTTDTLTVNAGNTWLNGARFYCVVSDQGGGSQTSNTATLTVKTLPLYVSTQPDQNGASFTLTETDRRVVLSCLAGGGDGYYYYQWYCRDEDSTEWIEMAATSETDNTKFYYGSTGPNLTIVLRDNLFSASNGLKFRCRIMDRTGLTIYSHVVTIYLDR